MALVIKDRVRQTSTTAGTGTITLSGSVTGYQDFTVIGTGNTTYYTIADQSGFNWEVGLGTYTAPNQLARTTVYESSNGNALVNFGSNIKDVFVTLPAEGFAAPPAIGGTTPNDVTATNLNVNTEQVFNTVTVGNAGTAHQVMVDADGTYDVLDTYMDDGAGGKYPVRFSGGINTYPLYLLSPDYATNYQYIALQPPSGMSSSYTLTLPATAGSNNQVLKTDGSGNLSWTNKFVLGAGTSTAGTAPLKFTSGTNLTTAETGAMEYDGTVAYFTPSGTARALNFTPYYFRNNTQVTLNNATGNQSILGLTNGVTLAASTIYEIECEFKLTTSGTTSHTEAFGFAGTATANNVHISMTRQNSLIGSGTAGNGAWFYTTIVVNTVTAAITTAQEVTYKLRGNISVNASGTFRPVIAFSAAPGGTSTIAAGAWLRVTPLGASGSNISIGTWT